jgi:hypothetical protein
MRRVTYWLKNRLTKNLLVVLTDGELVWSKSLHDFDWERANALPTTLQSCFQEEPLYLDLRWAKTSEDLSLQNPRFRDAIADLAATIRAISKEELVGEDVRQHRKTRRLAWSAVSIQAALLIVATASAPCCAKFCVYYPNRFIVYNMIMPAVLRLVLMAGGSPAALPLRSGASPPPYAATAYQIHDGPLPEKVQTVRSGRLRESASRNADTEFLRSITHTLGDPKFICAAMR